MELYVNAIVGLLLLTPCHCNFPLVNSNVNNTECCLSVPRRFDDCYATSLDHPISSKSSNIDCLQRLLWDTKHEQKLSVADRKYFSLLSKSNVRHGTPQPKTGFRVRKEYRRYTDAERTRLHNAFQNLYQKGVLRKYAELHRQAVNKTHNSPAFLAWHRVFLAMFEDELRLEDNSVSLPYWDTTLDEGMDNPANSIIWSSTFLGNANGDVITGHFAGWKSARGNLWRDYGSHPRGKLISEKKINKILTRCKTDDIVFPAQGANVEEANNYIIEYHSNGAHNWVGGDMSDKHFATYDPVFYMLHAYVDLIWEQFRIRQKTFCGVDPETDYPSKIGRPGILPNDFMDGFDGLRYIDGLKNYWTKNWYNYENIPKCPDCGSNYLFCNNIKGKCISHSRRTDYNAGLYITTPLSGMLGLSAKAFEPKTELILKAIFAKFLPAPLRDKRTRASAKHDAKKAAGHLGSPASAGHIQLTTELTPFLPAPPPSHTTMIPPIHNLINATVSSPNVASLKPVLLKQGGIVSKKNNTVNKHLDPSTNASIKGSNSGSANNIVSLLNTYLNMLKHNIPALVRQGHTSTNKNQSLPVSKTSKPFLNETLKTIDLLPRLQNHRTNRNLPTNLTQGSGITHYPPLIHLVDIMNKNHSVQSKPILHRRKYLRFF